MDTRLFVSDEVAFALIVVVTLAFLSTSLLVRVTKFVCLLTVNAILISWLLAFVQRHQSLSALFDSAVVRLADLAHAARQAWATAST